MVSAACKLMILLFPILFRAVEASAGTEQELLAQIQTARALEDAGEWTRALSIYEMLNRQRSDHPLVLEGYFECCLKMKKYDEAFAAVEKHLSNHAEDIHVSCLRGRVFARSGRKTEAIEAWNRLLASHPKEEAVYRSVADAMNQEQLPSEAVLVYAKGRKMTGRPDAFALELSFLHETQSEYGKAAKELMAYFRSQPDQGDHVQSRLARFPKNESVSNELFNIFSKMPDIQSGNERFFGLFVQYALLSGKYSDAFNATKDIEGRAATKNKGIALLQLANEASTSGSYPEAEKTYREILNQYPDFAKKAELYFGLAKCCQAQKNYKEALHFYEKVIGLNPDPGFFKEALLKKAQLSMNFLDDYHGAIQTLKILIDKFPHSPEHDGWMVEMGKCDLALGNFVSAESAFQAALESEKKRSEGKWIPPLALLARTYFYQNKLDESQKLLNQLSMDNLKPAFYQDPLLNDALELKIFITQYQDRCPDGVRFFAQAEFLQKQKRLKEALSALDSIPERCNENGIQAEAIFKQADILLKMTQYAECRSLVSLFLKKYPDHLKAGQAMSLLAKTYEETGYFAEAINQYDRIIREYPNTLAAEESRTRIQILQEKSKP